MNKINIKDIKNYLNQEIEISAFVDKVRDLPYVQFVILRDGASKVQVTLEKETIDPKLVSLVSSLTNESTVKIIGKVISNESVKLNQTEIIPSNIFITSLSKKELPFDYKSKDNSLRETRLDYRFIDLRNEKNNLFFKCQTLLEHAMREYFINNNFMEIHSPKISGTNAESGAEVFKLDYFGKEACLSQSPQFYKQMAMASGFNKVFGIGPAFRAENSHTSYHATEINMLDVEVSWINSFEDIMDLQEEWIKYSLNKLNSVYQDEIKQHYNVQISNLNNPFPRITFYEAKEILKDKYHYVSEKTDDLERKEEELLCQYAKEKHNSDFIFITKFPYSARPFYHMQDNNGLTYSYDLLFKGLEITTGAQREHRVDILKNQIKEKGIDTSQIEFYTDFFEYGIPPHGGFGLGISRLMMKIFELDNIREATFIYRGPNRLNP